MQRVTQYNLPAKGGNPVVIRCTMVSSRMEVVEDGSANAGTQQGLIYQLLTPQGNGFFTAGATVTVAPALSLEPVLLAGYPGDHPPNTVPIGNGGSGSNPVGPGAQPTLGTAVAQMTSASATPTVADVTEWS